MKLLTVATSACALLLLSACNQPAANSQAEAPASAPEPAPAETPDSAPPSLVTDTWVGKWTGPEGLFLEIKAGATPGAYALTLKDNLDTQADYPAQATGDMITFTRAGKTETIRAGTGAETGFKYLADKRDCLIVVANTEGYCRD